MKELPRLAFIGLGTMGRPMAGHLVEAGYRLTVNTRTPATATELLDRGAVWAETAAQAAADSDIVMTMLPDTPDVEAVVLGPGGVAEGARPGLVAIDFSTIDPPVTRRIAAELARRDVTMLDAPVSGGERGARDASLSIMVGGSSEAFEAVRPILDMLGRTIVRIGDSGAGQIAKACNQLVVGANIEAVAEALYLAARSGIDPAVVREVLLGGFAASRVLEVHGQRMIDRTFEPGFRVRLHRKDGRIVRALAASVGAPVPAFAVVDDAFARLDDEGGGDLDHSALIRLLEADAPRASADRAGRADSVDPPDPPDPAAG